MTWYIQLDWDCFFRVVSCSVFYTVYAIWMLHLCWCGCGKWLFVIDSHILFFCLKNGYLRTCKSWNMHSALTLLLPIRGIYSHGADLAFRCFVKQFSKETAQNHTNNSNLDCYKLWMLQCLTVACLLPPHHILTKWAVNLCRLNQWRNSTEHVGNSWSSIYLVEYPNPGRSYWKPWI